MPGRTWAEASEGRRAFMSLHRNTIKLAALAERGAAARLVRLDRGGVDYLIDRDSRSTLIGEGGPDWFGLTSDGRARLVKSGEARSVWRVDCDSGVYFAKVFTGRGLWSRVRGILTGSPAEREWRVLQEAVSRGVGVPRALAVGVETSGQGRCVLITEEVSGARDLSTAWEEDVVGRSGGKRRHAATRLLGPVAVLIAGAHRRGVIHRDPHPRNILVRRGASAADAEAIFLDVYGATLQRGPGSQPTLARTLAQLDQTFQRTATRTERLRFAKAVLDASPLGERIAPPPLRVFLSGVRRASLRHRARLAAQRDRRQRGAGKYFARLRLGHGWEALVVLRLERRHLFPEPTTTDRTVAQWRTLLSDRLGAIENGGGRIESDGLAIEPRRATGLAERLAWTLGGPPDQRTFLTCHRLRHRDEAQPLVLGFARRRRWGLIDRTALILPSGAESTSPLSDP